MGRGLIGMSPVGDRAEKKGFLRSREKVAANDKLDVNKFKNGNWSNQ